MAETTSASGQPLTAQPAWPAHEPPPDRPETSQIAPSDLLSTGAEAASKSPRLRSSIPNSPRPVLDRTDFVNGDELPSAMESPKSSPQRSAVDEGSDDDDDDDEDPQASTELESPARSESPPSSYSPNDGRHHPGVQRYVDNVTMLKEEDISISPSSPNGHAHILSAQPVRDLSIPAEREDNAPAAGRRRDARRSQRHGSIGSPAQLSHLRLESFNPPAAHGASRAQQNGHDALPSSVNNPRASSAPPLVIEAATNGTNLAAAANPFSHPFVSQFPHKILPKDTSAHPPTTFKPATNITTTTTFVPYMHPDQKSKPGVSMNQVALHHGTGNQAASRGKGRKAATRAGMSKVVFFEPRLKLEADQRPPRRHSTVTTTTFVDGWHPAQQHVAADSTPLENPVMDTRSHSTPGGYDMRDIKTRESTPGEAPAANAASLSDEMANANVTRAQSNSSSQTKLETATEDAEVESAPAPVRKRRGRPARKVENPEPKPAATLPKKGPQGRRKKRSANPYIQVRYDRQAQLRSNYRELAKKIKLSLEALAERDLETLRETRSYYKTRPEYKTTIAELTKIRDDYIREADFYAQYRLDHLQQNLELDRDYVRRREIFARADIQEKSLLRLQRKWLDIRSGRSDSEPHVALLTEDSLSADDSDSSKRPALRTADDHATKRQSLLAVSSAAPLVLPDGEFETTPLVETASRADASGAGTPNNRGTKRSAQEAVEFDEHDTYVPKRVRRGRMQEPNNRIVVRAPFQFEEWEIGLRELHKEKLNVPAAMDYFRFDQIAGNYNSTELLHGDMDADTVARHKLHPVYGVPIPGSVNPDVDEPFDVSAPLARTYPVEFINKEGKPQLTSRSVYWVYAHEDWEDHLATGDQERPTDRSVEDAQRKMRAALKGWHPSAMPSPAEPKTPPDEPAQHYVATTEDMDVDADEPSADKLHELLSAANECFREPEPTLALTPMAPVPPMVYESVEPKHDLYQGSALVSQIPRNPLEVLADVLDRHVPGVEAPFLTQPPMPPYPPVSNQPSSTTHRHFLPRHSHSPVPSPAEQRTMADTLRRSSEGIRPIFPAPPRLPYTSLPPLPMLSQGGSIPPILPNLAPAPPMPPPPPPRPSLGSPFPPSNRLPMPYLQPLSQGPPSMSPSSSSHYRELRPAPPQSSAHSKDPCSLFNPNTLPPPTRSYQSPPQTHQSPAQSYPYNHYHPPYRQ